MEYKLLLKHSGVTDEEKETDPPGQRESVLYPECQRQLQLISHPQRQISVWILSKQKQVPNFERRRSKTDDKSKQSPAFLITNNNNTNAIKNYQQGHPKCLKSATTAIPWKKRNS
jgi:hypothetical protein